MLHGLRTVGLVVDDLDAAKRWYTEVLGFGPYFDQPFYVGFDVDGYELGLQPRENAGTALPGRATTYWSVADADAALERLVSLGATLTDPAQDVGGGIRIGAVRDPFGNPLGVIVNPEFRAEIGSRVAATGAELSDRVVVREVAVAAPPTEVFRLWTTEEGFRAWLLPDCHVDLRLGGPLELFFGRKTAPPGLQGTEGCRYLAFLPPRLLCFTWNAPTNFATREQKTWVILEFTAVPGGTHVRLTHTGWPAAGLADPTTDWPATFAYFEGAWAQVLAALARHCGALSTAAG